MATSKLLSDELARRQGRTKPEPSYRDPDVAIKTQGPLTPITIRLGPGNIGTSGAFEFVSPAPGKMILQCQGAGSVAKVFFTENGAEWDLNSGNALTVNTFFEFEFAVDSGDTVFLTGVTLARGFWRPY